MERFKFSDKGITLISLVVTIIVLIILAGVSINIILGEDGIINKAKESRKMQDIARISDKLELEKADRSIEDRGAPDYEKYLQQLIDKGIIDESDIERNQEREESSNVTLEEKYIFLIEKEENGNIKIEYLGEVGNILPRIESVVVSSTSNSLNLNFKLKYTEKYSITIKEESEEAYGKEEIIKLEDKNVSKTFSGLKNKTTYNIIIKAYSSNGEEVVKEVSGITVDIADLITAEITFDYNPAGWVNTSIVATAVLEESVKQELEDKGYKLQTSKDGENWDDTASQTFTENGAVYARVYDGVNEYASTTGNVDKIDKDRPTVSSVNVTTNSATITATDVGGSGVKEYAVTTTNVAPTTGFQESKTITNLAAGTTYYAWAKDTVGNVSGTGKQFTTGTVTGLIITESEADKYTKTKTITITALDNNYSQIRYTTAEIPAMSAPVQPDEPTLTTGTEIKSGGTFQVSMPTIIKAIAFDSTNQVGEVATVTVRKSDSELPVINQELSSSDVTTSGFKLNLRVTDLRSGIAKIVWKYKLSTATAYTTVETKYAEIGGTTQGKADLGVVVTKEITGLEAGKTYNAIADVYDVAGNKITSKEITVQVEYLTLASIVKTGDYVKYEIDEKSYTITTGQTGYTSNQTFNTKDATNSWQVLYNDETNGLQIISSKSVVTLGIGTNSNVANARIAYNNIITTLNSISNQYVNDNYATSARSIGSNPINPADGITSLYTVPANYPTGSYTGFKVTDTYYTEDEIAMKNATNISDIDELYFLASRYAYADNDGNIIFYVRGVNTNGEIVHSQYYIQGCSDGAGLYSGFAKTCSSGVRPVVTLIQDIKVTGGKGTKEEPYILQPKQ